MRIIHSMSFTLSDRKSEISFLKSNQFDADIPLQNQDTYYNGMNMCFLFKCCTVDPVYSERGCSEYPLIVNGFLRTDR